MPADSRVLLWLATFLAATAWTSLGWAATPDPLVVDLFFDVAGDDLAEANANGGDGAPGASEILIGGIPLRLGEGATDGGWRSMAGANGRYTLPIMGNLVAISRLRLARTEFVDDGVADRSVASAATEFRYASGGWTFGLQPGLEVTRWDTDVVQQESSIEARLSRALGGGLSLVTSGRYRWRILTGEAADRAIASSRTGFVYTLPERLRLDMAYVVRNEVIEGGADRALPATTRSIGPSVALALPLGDDLDLSANYDFTETTERTAAAGSAGETRNLHQLGLALAWDVGGRATDVELSTAYNYGRLNAAGDTDETRHAGTVSFAFNF